MRVLLVKAAHITSTDVSIVAPLGLLYLAAMLQRNRPHDDIQILDLRVESDERYTEALRQWQPDIVGISALTVESGHAHALAGLARTHAPKARVVLGGPHPTGYWETDLRNPHIDVAVLHEGELTFVELLNAIERGDRLSKVAGIALRDGNGIPVQTAARPYVFDLDTLPLPAWHLHPFERYEHVKSMSLVGPRRVAPVLTSRACPYRCTYCHDMFGKKFQQRSPQHVLDELDLLRNRYGVRHIEIVDDIFNIDRKRAATILQGIIDRRLDLQLAFPNGLRGDLLDDDLIDLFVRAGTIFVSIAVETASPRLQRHIRKHIRLPAVEHSIRAFVRRGVFTNCYYMLGFPTETYRELAQTIRYAWRQPSHTALFFVVNPYRGTALDAEVHPHGPEPDERAQPSYHSAAANVSPIHPLALAIAVRLAYAGFLLNPMRLWRILRDHPRKRYLLGMAWLLLRRLTIDVLNEQSRQRKAAAAKA